MAIQTPKTTTTTADGWVGLGCAALGWAALGWAAVHTPRSLGTTGWRETWGRGGGNGHGYTVWGMKAFLWRWTTVLRGAERLLRGRLADWGGCTAGGGGFLPELNRCVRGWWWGDGARPALYSRVCPLGFFRRRQEEDATAGVRRACFGPPRRKATATASDIAIEKR